jgi:SAM-dependent methyltransferase
MKVPDRRRLTRQGHVQALGGNEPVDPLQGDVARGNRLFQAPAHGVQRAARLAVTHFSQGELELALPAQEAHPRLVELVEGIRPFDRAQSLVLERLGVHPPTVPSAFVASPYDPFAAVYDAWASDMTEDVPFYVELARATPEGPIVELAVGTGRVAVPVALETGRRVIGIDVTAPMLAQARVRAEQTGADLDLREGDMRDFSLDEPAALVYCPYRSLLHLPTWQDKRRVFERVAASLRPGGRFAWNAFAFNGRMAASVEGHHPDDAVPHTIRQAYADNRVDIELDTGGAISLWWVTKSEWEGLIDVAGLEVEALYGWFDRRPFDDESMEFVWVTRKPV